MKRRSVMYTWVLFDILLISMVLLMCIIVGRSARNQFTDEYKTITETLQSQSNTAISDFFDELESRAYEICNDYVVTGFVSVKDPTGSKYYDLTPIQQTLSTYAVQSDGSVECYLYMSNIGKALSRSTIYTAEELYMQLNLSSLWNEEVYLQELESYQYHNLYVVTSEIGDTTVIMLTSIPMVGSTKGMLIQAVDQSALESMIQSSTAVENSTTVLMSQEGVLIGVAGDDTVASMLQSADLDTVENSEILLEDGESYWIQSTQLRSSGWDLITVVPVSVIQEKSDSIIRRIAPIALVIIFLLVVICLFFLIMIYQPIRKLRVQLAPPAGKFKGNEYEHFALALNDARTGLAQIQKLWDEQTEALRREYILSCLNGNTVDEALSMQMLEQLDISFAGEYFAVAIFGAGNLKEAQKESKETQKEDYEKALWEAAAGEEGFLAFYLLPNEDHWCIVINMRDDDHDMQAFMHKVMGALSHGQAEMKVACSKARKSFASIHLSYLEVKENLWHQDHPEAPSNVKGKSFMPPYLPPEQEELLTKYIAAGNLEKAEEMYSQIYKYNWEARNLPMEMLRCLSYDLISGMIKGMPPTETLSDGQYEFLQQTLHRMRSTSDREQLAEIVRFTVKRLTMSCAKAHQDAAADREQPMLDRIMKCVNEHYRDRDFSVSRCAEYLNVSVPYVSSIFKQQAGIGLLNYINGLRVKYAKQRIQESHITVKEAAREAGFENTNTFIRIFKQYEGITPGRI